MAIAGGLGERLSVSHQNLSCILWRRTSRLLSMEKAIINGQKWSKIFSSSLHVFFF